MDFERLARFSGYSKCRRWCWILALLFLNTGSCMWTPRPVVVSHTSIGPTNDRVWRMKGSSYDEDYCPLNTLGTYPYLVKVYRDNPDAHLYFRTGVLISHTAVLTVCRVYNSVSFSELTVTAQRIFRKRGLLNDYCYQTRTIKDTIKHPKCDLRPSGIPADAYWDFRVLILDAMFHAEKEFAYPVIPIPKQPYDLMQLIRKVSILHRDVEGCELPYFAIYIAPWPILTYTAKVDPQMHEGACIRDLCTYHFAEELNCQDDLNSHLNYSLLCLEAKFRRKIEADKIPYWYGSPLVCNNTGIGISTADLIRYDKTIDWWVISTFLRPWPWLMRMKHKYWLPFYNRDGTWDSPFFGQHQWGRQVFPTEKYDKNISKEWKSFRFVKPHGYQPRSGGNRFHVTFTIYVHAAFIPVILNA